MYYYCVIYRYSLCVYIHIYTYTHILHIHLYLHARDGSSIWSLVISCRWNSCYASATKLICLICKILKYVIDINTVTITSVNIFKSWINMSIGMFYQTCFPSRIRNIQNTIKCSEVFYLNIFSIGVTWYMDIFYQCYIYMYKIYVGLIIVYANEFVNILFSKFVGGICA